MISFSLSLKNPWHKFIQNEEGHPSFARYCKSYKITKNKSSEVEFIKRPTAYNIFGISVNTIFTGQNHAGVSLYLELLNIELSVIVYDNRHWNYEKGAWEIYDADMRD